MAVHDEPQYIQGLNPPQREAVETIDGPLLVLAGAGTGKTRVLTTRLAHIINSNKAFPSQILAVTFTNKAAQEMKFRVSDLLGGQTVEGWWLGTFHALSARMLRRHADFVGLGSNFTVIDTDDQVRLVKQLMEPENIDVKKWPPKVIAGYISKWKDRALRPEDLKMDDVGDVANGKALKIYRQYQDRLKLINACDFGDLLLHMIHILKAQANSHVLADYHRQFKYVMVDEYQDTNVAQYLWLRLLAQGSGNICCVGDDDQSIYGWRGAEVGNILRFEHDFPGAKIVRLEQNYRSTGHILSAASGVIANNQGRHDKTLWSDQGHGEKVVVKGLWDGQAEARWVAEEIESLQTKKVSLNTIAILVRAGFQMRAFEERLNQIGIPYKVFGGPRFYERQEIRDALAYLRVVAQPDDDLALERIMNTPKRGIGTTTLRLLHVHARAQGISLYRAIIDLVGTDELKPKVKNILVSLMKDFDRWREQIATTHHSDLAGIILDESGYTDMWQNTKTPDAPGRLENLKEFTAAMAEFETLEDFLEYVSLVLENNNNENVDSVNLMTLHAAKGLEFNIVFLPGWEQNLFPSQRSVDHQGIEEERRLAYVGITRAREKLYISYAASRMMYGEWINTIPSQFVNELPADHVETEMDISSNTHISAVGRSSHWDSSGHWDKSGIRSRTQSSRSIANNYKADMAQKSEGSNALAPGKKVFHDKFGNGVIVHVDGQKLDINFSKSGHKRVMASFIELLD